jgi:SAM-dependent methyltransferase
MIYLFIVLLALALAFGGAILRGAPYLPTLDPQARAALALLELQPGQTLLELGSGDGKVLLVAAQAGLNVVGIELNPFLVLVSRLRTWRYRRQVRVIWGDFWRVDWPECDAVFAFLLGRFMGKLDARMVQLKKPLVSFAFKVPGRKVDAERAGVFLYRYERGQTN